MHAQIIPDSASSLQRVSETRLLSPRASRLGRTAYWFLFVAAILYTLQLIPHEFQYIQSQALEIEVAGLRPLYWMLLLLGFHLIRISYLVASVIIFRHKSDNFMHLFVALFLLTFSISANLVLTYMPDYSAYARQNFLEPGLYLFNMLGWSLFFIFLYIFPTGRLSPRWSGIGLLIGFAFTVSWGFPTDSPIHPNNWNPLIIAVVAVPVFAIPLIAQVYRYRRIYTPIERQQSKWVIWAIIGILTCFIAIISVWMILIPDAYVIGSISYDVISQIGNYSLLLIPFSLVLAMLRYRLWDVDLVINRSLVYGTFIVLILLIFFAILFVSQIVLGQTQVLVTLLISLLCSVLTFNFVRKHVQYLVDHYIYHLRFDLNQVAKAQEPISNAGAISGKQFGRYHILDLLGRGGMGEVYKAKDGDKFVAIKTLHVEKTMDPEILNRFQREGKAGMDLNHPNIVPVYEMAVQDGVPYIVMAYLDGEDLADYLKENKKMDSQMIMEIVCDVASALEFAHSQGLIHRDVKPSNVLLMPTEDKETFRAILADFGVAKIKDANTLTKTGAIGTIDYMAPEQIASAKTVDQRADIYALGVMLYEMAVGERPFKGSVGQVLFAHIQQPAPDPRDSDETIPRSLAKTILKALEKDPEDRFQTAGEIIASLQANRVESFSTPSA